MMLVLLTLMTKRGCWLPLWDNERINSTKKKWESFWFFFSCQNSSLKIIGSISCQHAEWSPQAKCYHVLSIFWIVYIDVVDEWIDYLKDFKMTRLKNPCPDPIPGSVGIWNVKKGLSNSCWQFFNEIFIDIFPLRTNCSIQPRYLTSDW
jgi:hypothetical protein